jgi:hypothetical protein
MSEASRYLNTDVLGPAWLSLAGERPIRMRVETDSPGHPAQLQAQGIRPSSVMMSVSIADLRAVPKAATYD